MAVLLGNRQIRVHLAAGTLIACEVRRMWHRTVVLRKARFDFEHGDRAPAMDALADWIGQSGGRRSIVWIIGPAQAQSFVLPWSPALIDQTMRDAYARARFEQIYEREASGAVFEFGACSQGKGQVVSWIPVELARELASHADRTDCQLAAIQPVISTVWKRFRDVLEAEQGTLCIVDGDRETIVQHDGTVIQDIVFKSSGPAPLTASRRKGVFRRFSNEPSRSCVGSSADDLNLPTRNGFVAANDAEYAFALCGAL